MFSNIANALQTVKQYGKIDDQDTLHDPLLINLLEISKGQDKITLIPEYRPFIVTAYFLEFHRLNDGVIEASGTDTVKFESSDKLIQGLYNMQKTLDVNIVNIPNTWNIQTRLKPFSAFIV